MKKNKALRAASALLVLTLLTTSIIGGTFAKYTSRGSVNDTARVAKWGVDITTSGALYSDAYAIATGDNLPATWTSASPDATQITVAAETQRAVSYTHLPAAHTICQSVTCSKNVRKNLVNKSN